jgi:hypothetical protein
MQEFLALVAAEIVLVVLAALLREIERRVRGAIA